MYANTGDGTLLFVEQWESKEILGAHLQTDHFLKFGENIVGLVDGDLIIVRKQNTCEEGDIIAALIDDEATVKRFGKKNGIPYLFPENDDYSPIPFNTEGCRVLGKVVGLHRNSIN